MGAKVEAAGQLKVLLESHMTFTRSNLSEQVTKLAQIQGNNLSLWKELQGVCSLFFFNLNYTNLLSSLFWIE